MPEPSTSVTTPSDSKPIKALFYRDWDNSYIPEILEEVYLKKVYQPFVTGRRDLIVADWGANQGLTVNYFSKYAKVVYAVEPSKQHIEVINKLVEFNELKNVKICPYAVSNKNDTERFFHPENVTMFSMENVMGAPDYEEVETVDPETFFEREKIDHLDILKFDVEGSESKIIASDSFKKVAPKIKVICGEWHNWTDMGKDAFANAFRDLGYQFKWRTDTQASVFDAVRI